MWQTVGWGGEGGGPVSYIVLQMKKRIMLDGEAKYLLLVFTYVQYIQYNTYDTYSAALRDLLVIKRQVTEMFPSPRCNPHTWPPSAAARLTGSGLREPPWTCECECDVSFIKSKAISKTSGSGVLRQDGYGIWMAVMNGRERHDSTAHHTPYSSQVQIRRTCQMQFSLVHMFKYTKSKHPL